MFQSLLIFNDFVVTVINGKEFIYITSESSNFIINPNNNCLERIDDISSNNHLKQLKILFGDINIEYTDEKKVIAGYKSQRIKCSNNPESVLKFNMDLYTTKIEGLSATAYPEYIHNESRNQFTVINLKSNELMAQLFIEMSNSGKIIHHQTIEVISIKEEKKHIKDYYKYLAYCIL